MLTNFQGGRNLDQITSWIEQWIGLGPDTQAKVLYSVIALLIIWIIRAIAVKAAKADTLG